MDDLVLQIRQDGTLLEFRGQLTHTLLSSAEVLGQNVCDIMPSDIAQQIMRSVERVLQTGDLHSFQYQLPTKNKNHYEVKFIVCGEDRVFALISNITQYKRAAENAKYLAYHDTLTGLPNRYLFNDRLKQAIAHAEREKQLMAILFLDIDNFKHTNDTIGHKAGDVLLQSVAERLTRCLRSADSVSRLSPGESETLVARLGGDEFTMLLSDISNIQDPAKVAQRILSMVAEPFIIGSHEVFITASLGIAVYPFDGKDLDTLLVNADVAMYQAKDQGRNNYQYYSESMNRFTFERFSIEHKLRRALDHNEFMLFYQPQIDIRTGKMIGVEALIRWLQPDLVLIKPNEFIPLAEETGLIIPIGEWVLRTACAQNKAWQKAGLNSIRMTVNVSGVQFKQQNFVEMVSQVLNDTGLAQECLQLELTESTIMKDSENTIRKLHALQAMGIQVAIDDFGTGYSSLNYLKRFPLSTLKIDYSFVRDLISSSVDQSIVNAIVSLAHNFNLKVIAEGVETKKQLTFLHEARCGGVQGYLICPPVNAVSLRQFMMKESYRGILNSCGIQYG
ncbi:MAG TPA: EAL domain-containing protein [Thermodesulfovibrionales bacterium]|nr:EAL domain-containing protein [Thermodesulfovibrionales bacterium]